MDTKHKPAPWSVTEHFYVTNVHGVLAGDELVCGDIGSIKDARLIAAAPDLLEALERMQENLGCDEPDCAICLCARAAIAKAKGEQP